MMPILDKIVDIWRMAANPGGAAGKSDQKIYAGIRAAIVPASTFDLAQEYARQSTHVLFVPAWLVLRSEDEVRYGRRDPDPRGVFLPETFIVNGRRRFSQSTSLAQYYVKERV